MITEDHETNSALFKVLIAWVGTAVGGMSLSNFVLITTLIFTLIQIFVIVRKIWRGDV